MHLVILAHCVVSFALSSPGKHRAPVALKEHIMKFTNIVWGV